MNNKQMFLIFGVIAILAIAIILACFSLIKYGKYVMSNPIEVTIEKTDLQSCVCYDSNYEEYKFGNIIDTSQSFESIEID